MFSEKKLQEKAILDLIDQLVLVLIDLSHSNSEQRTELFAQAVSLARQSCPLLLSLLAVEKQHLESLLQQLIMQKLPQSLILSSFGTLSEDLREVLTEALTLEDCLFREPQLPEAEATAQPEPSESCSGQICVEDSLESLLRSLYPLEQIIKDYSQGSLTLDYYLPKRNTGFIFINPSSRNLKLKQQLLKKSGITTIEIKPEELSNLRLLIRKFPRF